METSLHCGDFGTQVDEGEFWLRGQSINCMKLRGQVKII